MTTSNINSANADAPHAVRADGEQQFRSVESIGDSVQPGHGSAGAVTSVWTWVLLSVNVTVLGVAYGPLLGPFFVRQWSQPQYQYFPFVIGAFVWLLWRNSRSTQVAPGNDTWMSAGLSIACLIFAWILLALAYLVASPWLAAISAMMIVGAGLLRLSQRWRIHYGWGLWLMLWLIIPLPLNRDQQLITGLQHLSSRLSSALLDSIGVNHLMEGNTLHLPGQQFFVDEACSGIVSVLSVIACAVILGIWRDRRAAHVLVLVICGIVWATLMNVGRIVTIAVAYDWAGIDWSTGATHEILGLVFFTLVFLALVCTDLFLVGLLAPIEPTLCEVAGGPSQLGRNWIKIWDWLFSASKRGEMPPEPIINSNNWRRIQQVSLGWAALVAFAALPVVVATQALSAGTNGHRASVAPEHVVNRALACQRSTLPENIQQLSLTKFSQVERERDDLLGNHSRIFEYRDADGTTYLVSCDFPYQGGWHELTVCYRGIGWELVSRRVVHEAIRANGQTWTDMEAEFLKPDGNQGFLAASAFDENGTALDLPAYTFWEDVWRKLTLHNSAPPSQVAFQIQVWMTSGQPISDQQRATARNLLQTSRKRFYDATIGTTSDNRS